MVSETTSATFWIFFLQNVPLRVCPSTGCSTFDPFSFGRSQVARLVDWDPLSAVAWKGAIWRYTPEVSISTSRDPFVDFWYSYHHSKTHFDKAYFFGGGASVSFQAALHIGRKYNEHIGILYITYFIAFTCNYSLTTT